MLPFDEHWSKLVNAESISERSFSYFASIVRKIGRGIKPLSSNYNFHSIKRAPKK